MHFYDDFFYITNSYYMASSGQEAMFQYFDKLYQSDLIQPRPYHYFDLWIYVVFIKIFSFLSIPIIANIMVPFFVSSVMGLTLYFCVKNLEIDNNYLSILIAFAFIYGVILVPRFGSEIVSPLLTAKVGVNYIFAVLISWSLINRRIESFRYLLLVYGFINIVNIPVSVSLYLVSMFFYRIKATNFILHCLLLIFWILFYHYYGGFIPQGLQEESTKISIMFYSIPLEFIKEIIMNLFLIMLLVWETVVNRKKIRDFVLITASITVTTLSFSLLGNDFNSFQFVTIAQQPILSTYFLMLIIKKFKGNKWFNKATIVILTMYLIYSIFIFSNYVGQLKKDNFLNFKKEKIEKLTSISNEFHSPIGAIIDDGNKVAHSPFLTNMFTVVKPNLILVSLNLSSKNKPGNSKYLIEKMPGSMKNFVDSPNYYMKQIKKFQFPYLVVGKYKDDPIYSNFYSRQFELNDRYLLYY